MIILMQLDASEAQIQAVVEVIREAGHEPLVLPGGDRTAIGVPDALSAEEKITLEGIVSRMDGVSLVTQTSRPYKLASVEFHRSRTTIKVKKAVIGAGTFTVFGGPCSIESYEQMQTCARIVKSAGGTVLRGGAFKPRTSPYSFQGMQEEGLKIMKQVGDDSGLATITEAMSAEQVGVIAPYVDIIQIGARSMQNFPLLIEAGKSGKPVFLKRGPSATIDEFILAAEYVLSNGNPNVILCERGIVPLDRSYARNTLDLTAIPILKEHTHLPVVADPSHGTGVARYVAPMAKAAMAAGADGVMIEMHPKPKEAKSDGSQALDTEAYNKLMAELHGLAGYFGVKM